MLMKIKTILACILAGLLGNVGQAGAQTAAPVRGAALAGCQYTAWTRGVNYPLGAIVLYQANGRFYKVVNVGSNGSDGTDPTISSWYWAPTTCDAGSPPPSGGGSFVVGRATFDQMFPTRNAFYTYDGLIAALKKYPEFATEPDQAVARQEAAAFLANVSHETSGLVYIREVNQANWDKYCSIGNCGGKLYYGRGPMQLSWDYNYKTAGIALGLDLLGNPDWVATNAAIAWETALWFWMTQSGAGRMTPHQAMSTGQGFGETIRSINGALECNGGNAAERQDRIDTYKRFTGLLGTSVGGGNIGC
ncbi:chitinase [Burkholderia ubonensis]|nr:chitinase [Burkholderia ubonensis]KVA28356.1 chitinase [Burkholderia ubonensis]KVA49509.1 chitinase [Burkholderia ubonensis]KVC55138.1 chitinase [Burkholderia ubonensis]KVD92308.1 chitinase [Burkholderia ubonensis]